MTWQSHWEWWQEVMHAPMPEPKPIPEPEPVADVSAWEIEKRANRLARKLRQVATGVLQPRASYLLTGEAAAQVKATRELLAETVDTLKGAR